MAFLSEKLISASGGVQEETDDDFNLVTGLYHFDGSNAAQNNTFLDSSSNGFTVTKTGTIPQGAFSPFSSEDGKWSVEFPGGGTSDQSRIALGSTNEYVFGTGDFTIEAWIFPKSILAYSDANFVLDFRNGNAGYNIELYMFIASQGGTNNLYGTVGQSSGGITVGAWNHIAISRASGTQKGFINGVEKFSASDTANHQYSGSGVNIGNRYASTWNPFDGFISNVRIVKGTAVYTGNFTPSTSPLTNVTNTVNLGLRSNRFVDSVSSVVPYLNTNSGPIKIQPFSPFAPSSSYDAATKGGSGYFDNDTYLTIADNSNLDISGAFTAEAWIYVVDFPDGNLGATGQGFVLTRWVASGNQRSWGIFLGNDGAIAAYVSTNGSATYTGTATSSSGVIKKGSWHHVAQAWDGSTNRMLVDGVVVASTSASTVNTAPNAPFTINALNTSLTGANQLVYISGARFVNNSALYTGSYTIPTAPPTAVSGTQALVNFTNAAMFDQTGKTNVETLGNAQLDTSVKKFGTASAEFDGTGDYLFLSPRPTLHFPRDFTIEFFFNSDVFQSDYNNLRALVSSGKFYTAGNNGNWILRLSTNARIAWASYDGTGSQVYQEFVMPTMSTGTWYHLAVVRNNGNIQIYLNGTASTSSAVADSKNLIDGATNGIYIGYANLTANNDYDGYIDEFRITQKARYTSNFTAPTKEFPNR